MCIYFFIFLCFYIVKIEISYLEYPVFDANAANIHIYEKKNVFMHTANILTYFEFPLKKKTNIRSLKENEYPKYYWE